MVQLIEAPKNKVVVETKNNFLEEIVSHTLHKWFEKGNYQLCGIGQWKFLCLLGKIYESNQCLSSPWFWHMDVGELLYDGMSPTMKQLLETMCECDFMSKNPDEAFEFLNYVAEIPRS